MTQDNDNSPPEEDWTAEEHSKLMSRYERIAAESAGQPSKDGQSVVAEFSLGGAVPRHEPSRGRYQSKDIYIRLENTIYGPVTQDELADMLASGELTGFESASADLQHWTPLIYHPKMALSGEIDPDATHGMLHDRSTLPAASRAPEKFDLEALADLEDDEPLPAMPLAAILIKPIKVSKKTGLPIPVHANLEQESLEEVRERTDIPESSRISGSQALVELALESQAHLGNTAELPPGTDEATEARRGTDGGRDLDSNAASTEAATSDVAGERTKPASEQMSAMVDAEIEALYAGLFDEPKEPNAPAPDGWGDSGHIEVDGSSAAAMRVASIGEPLPDADVEEVPAPAPPAKSSAGNQMAIYMIALLLLAVGAVVVLALMTQTTPSAPAPEEPPASVNEAPANEAPAVAADGSGEADGSGGPLPEPEATSGEAPAAASSNAPTLDGLGDQDEPPAQGSANGSE